MIQQVENMNWYVLRVIGGKERKTVSFIEKEIDRLGIKDFVSDFKNITLTFSGSSKSGGNYSTTNSIDADVWPNSGAWEFQNGDRSKLIRSDNVVMSISVTQTTLRTSFTVSGGLKEGNWVFDFVKQ